MFLCKHKGALFTIWFLFFFFNRGKFGVEGSKQAGPGGEILRSVRRGHLGQYWIFRTGCLLAFPPGLVLLRAGLLTRSGRGSSALAVPLSLLRRCCSAHGWRLEHLSPMLPTFLGLGSKAMKCTSSVHTNANLPSVLSFLDSPDFSSSWCGYNHLNTNCSSYHRSPRISAWFPFCYLTIVLYTEPLGPSVEETGHKSSNRYIESHPAPLSKQFRPSQRHRAEIWAAWSSGRCPSPRQGGWN